VTPIPTPRLDPIDDATEPPTPTPSISRSTPLHRLPSQASTTTSTDNTQANSSEYAASVASDTDAASVKSKRGWFKKRRSASRGGASLDKGSEMDVTIASSTSTGGTRRSDEGQDVHTPMERTVREDEWRLGDDIRMQLDI
jgi:hypothetical protein